MSIKLATKHGMPNLCNEANDKHINNYITVEILCAL